MQEEAEQPRRAAGERGREPADSATPSAAGDKKESAKTGTLPSAEGVPNRAGSAGGAQGGELIAASHAHAGHLSESRRTAVASHAESHQCRGAPLPAEAAGSPGSARSSHGEGGPAGLGNKSGAVVLQTDGGGKGRLEAEDRRLIPLGENRALGRTVGDGGGDARGAVRSVGLREENFAANREQAVSSEGVAVGAATAGEAKTAEAAAAVVAAGGGEALLQKPVIPVEALDETDPVAPVLNLLDERRNVVVLLDLETTGLSAKKDRVIQLAAKVRQRDGARCLLGRSGKTRSVLHSESMWRRSLR